MSLKEKIESKIRETLQLIKRALQHETKENKQMLRTYLRYTQGEASKDDMKLANAQFRSFLKTLGLGTLAVLPLAPLTIPMIVQLAKKFDIDLIPKYLKEDKNSK
ncbi:hypothetical protein M899_2955 [Bacteriovorax sp. BSW11_IV]|uniref:hypothetical protein n=1 Tax=Bacteriovorax sp. BSW11_IV TaxID=1353529 RepID=UPI00038A1034|nr:hypothetical protein [Bacteriovorax sp. BSW11_IV]EQC50161.1 hypothetical protein M899_2955 [Bacteriovorax sp. BSW11_IV]